MRRFRRGGFESSHLTRDVRFGLRFFLRNRTLSAIAVATMALGIGATTAVFSLVDGLLLRPLSFAAPDRLFHAGEIGMRGPFETMRSNSRLADYAAHLGVRAFNTAGREWPERVKGSEVSANFFEVLGTRPLIGRAFAAGEDRPASAPVVVLSHDYWVQRFGGRPDLLGQPLTLDEVGHEIVGVMPPGFQFPARDANFWVPMRLDPRDVGPYWGIGGVSAFARLRPGVSREAAESELRGWIPRIRGMFPWRMPDSWAADARLIGLHEHLVAGARLRSLLLFGVVALVLLIATVNVANLMIGQTAARQRELTLRTWLGATPGRLARQMLTEAVLLALAGGLLGVLVAYGLLELLRSLLPPDTPRLAEIALDARVLAFTSAISVGSGVLFGLLPAWHARRRRSVMPEDGRSTLSAPASRTHAVLVTAEAAFATVLLVGAGLLLRSLWVMLHVDPGFRVESVVTAEVGLNRAATESAAGTMAAVERIQHALASYPGLMNAAAMNVLPMTPVISATAVSIEDHPRPPEAAQFVLWSTAVTPDHLDTLGIRLLQGRRFTPADRQGTQPVILISRATARRFWPDRNPIGRRIRLVTGDEWQTIVGVVDDVKTYGIGGPPEWIDGEIYLPMAQERSPARTVTLIARVAGESSDFEKTLPRMIEEACATCALDAVKRLDAVVSAAVRTPRSMAWLVGGFALLALGLAGAGIYGVVRHGVLRRTRELGVRLALGASRRHVAWLVIGSSLRYTVAGVIVGLGASWALAHAIEALLYGVTATDPVSFAAAPAVLVAVALLACVSPLRRAIRIDPATSLRDG